MYHNNDNISSSQLRNIIILTIVGSGVLTLPRELVEEVGTDGWLLLILGALASMVITFLHGYIVRAFPKKSYFEILSITLTKPVAYLVFIVFFVYLIGISGFIVRIFGEVVKMFLLPRTPIEVIIITILGVVAYSTRKGVEPLGRIAEILLPIVIVLALVLFTLTFANADLGRLLPAMRTPPMDFIRSIPSVFFTFAGYELLLIFAFFLNKREDSVKIGSQAILVVLVFYMVLNFSVLSNFGAYQIQHLVWPTISVFKAIEFPGAFIENVEVLVMAIWVFAIFTTLVPLYLGGTITLSNMFKVREHNYFVLPLLPIVYFMSLFSDNLPQVYEQLGLFSRYTVYTVSLVTPILVLLSMKIRRLGKG